jgi:hypothetical protein
MTFTNILKGKIYFILKVSNQMIAPRPWSAVLLCYALGYDCGQEVRREGGPVKSDNENSINVLQLFWRFY